MDIRKNVYKALVCNIAFTPFAIEAKEVNKSIVDSKKPNVLFIIVDDWGAKDLSFSGSTFYETPNIDNLARQSTSFANAYNAYPRCVPSRYSMWTGMHCARPQVKKDNDGDGRHIDKNTLSFAEPFKENGYNTFFIGKWHLNTEDCTPLDKGFEINIGGGKAGATNSHFQPFNASKSEKADKKNDDIGGIEGMDDAAPGEYLTDYMTRKTVDYIKSEHVKPFFAAVCFYAVHTPIQAKKDIRDKYEKKKIDMGIAVDSFIREEAGERKALQNHAVYAAMVQSLDEGIGNLVKALKESGQYDNTIIVLVSDNGGLSNRGNTREVATNNNPYKAGKGHLYEGGIKTPLFIHIPKQSKAATSDVFTVGYDIFPTVAELCNVPVAKKLDGVSLAPILTGKKTDAFTNRKLYWHKVSERPTSTGDYVSTAIRSGDYKLIEFYLQNRVELYNIKNDISETTNLIDKEPEVASKLLADLHQWRKDMDVNMMTNIEKKKK